MKRLSSHLFFDLQVRGSIEVRDQAIQANNDGYECRSLCCPAAPFEAEQASKAFAVILLKFKRRGAPCDAITRGLLIQQPWGIRWTFCCTKAFSISLRRSPGWGDHLVTKAFRYSAPSENSSVGQAYRRGKASNRLCDMTLCQDVAGAPWLRFNLMAKRRATRCGRTTCEKSCHSTLLRDRPHGEFPLDRRADTVHVRTQRMTWRRRLLIALGNETEPSAHV
jgi:hypothetical protein